MIVLIDDSRTELTDVAEDSPPELYDVLKLLQCKSSQWRRIGRGLGIKYDYLEQLFSRKPDDEDKLEDALHKWIESQCSDVSWANLYDVLKYLELDDVAQDLQRKFPISSKVVANMNP